MHRPALDLEDLFPMATVSQLGIGLTIAVVLDATVVRIVLLRP